MFSEGQAYSTIPCEAIFWGDRGDGVLEIHKRRNGANGDETEKTAGRTRATGARVPTAGRHRVGAAGRQRRAPLAPPVFASVVRPHSRRRATRGASPFPARPHSAFWALRFPLSARRSRDRRGCECEPDIASIKKAGDACDIRLALAPDRASRGADSRKLPAQLDTFSVSSSLTSFLRL